MSGHSRGRASPVGHSRPGQSAEARRICEHASAARGSSTAGAAPPLPAGAPRGRTRYRNRCEANPAAVEAGQAPHGVVQGHLGVDGKSTDPAVHIRWSVSSATISTSAPAIMKSHALLIGGEHPGTVAVSSSALAMTSRTPLPSLEVASHRPRRFIGVPVREQAPRVAHRPVSSGRRSACRRGMAVRCSIDPGAVGTM